MTEILIFAPGRMPNEFCDKCHEFVVRQFLTDWGVKRKDILCEEFHNRVNAVMLKKGNIEAYLGMTAEGELVNGCAVTAHEGYKTLKVLAGEISQCGYDVKFARFFLNRSGLLTALSFYEFANGNLGFDGVDTLRFPEKNIDLHRMKIIDSVGYSKRDFLQMIKGL